MNFNLQYETSSIFYYNKHFFFLRIFKWSYFCRVADLIHNGTFLQKWLADLCSRNNEGNWKNLHLFTTEKRRDLLKITVVNQSCIFNSELLETTSTVSLWQNINVKKLINRFYILYFYTRLLYIYKPVW